MKIKEINIENFRNLDGLKLVLNPDLSFIIGENNLGKSNILDLLDIIFNKKSFNEDDFNNKEKEIVIELKLSLDDIEIEIGIFDDIFSPNPPLNNELNLTIKQENPDESIKIFHKETSILINQRKLRFANLVKYDPLRKPDNELNFSKKVGAGKFLNYLVGKYYNKDQSFINQSEIDSLIDNLNNSLKDLKYFSDFGIHVSYKKDIYDQILSLLELVDKNQISIFKTGYGIQFNLIIFLYLLYRVTEIIESKQNSIFEHNGKKYISLILCIDEPEIHMHPYMQRNFTKTISRIITNKDETFKKFLKENFQIDGIIGQAIIVTHSPYVLLNDYKQYVRIYNNENDSPSSVSGYQINLNETEEKHLYRQMHYIKEAFFAKYAVIVEGDTEYGAFPEWFEKSGIDMDKIGLSIIKADGKGSINPVETLLEQFQIKCWTFADRDGNKNNNYTNNYEFDFLTQGKDIEEDIINTLFDFSKEEEEKRDIIYNILSELLPDKFTEQQKKYRKGKLEKEETLKKLGEHKSIITGKIIGQNIPEKYIPESVKQLILEIKRICNGN